MQVLPFVRWRTQSLTETASTLTLKRGDTHPDLGIEVRVNGEEFSLLGTLVTARVRFTLSLEQYITDSTLRMRVSYDTRLRVGDIIVIEKEKVKVEQIDDTSDPGFLRIKVIRGQESTTAAAHESGVTMSVVLVERRASLISDDYNNKVVLEWSPGDTERLGDFEVEFQVSETGNDQIRYSIPTSPILVSVVSDFSGS